MTRTQIERSRKKVGHVPGALIYTGDSPNSKTRISLFSYDEYQTLKREIETVEDLVLEEGKKNFIDVLGVSDKEVVAGIGEKFGINTMLLEDIMHLGERPRIDYYDDYVFVILKVLSIDKINARISQSQIAFVLSDGYMIMFRDRDFEGFEQIEARLKDERQTLRKKGLDYLVYYIADMIVDNYLYVLGEIEEYIGLLEEKVISKEKSQIEDVYKLRKSLLVIKSATWPMNDIVKSIMREDSFFSDTTKEYIRDLHGNISQIIEHVGIYREEIVGLIDIFLSNNGNRMNEIMQTLTIISIMFIPPTFLAGVYGMNFDVLPELRFEHGYWVFWVVTIASMIGMYKYFKKRHWL